MTTGWDPHLAVLAEVQWRVREVAVAARDEGSLIAGLCRVAAECSGATTVRMWRLDGEGTLRLEPVLAGLGDDAWTKREAISCAGDGESDHPLVGVVRRDGVIVRNPGQLEVAGGDGWRLGRTDEAAVAAAWTSGETRLGVVTAIGAAGGGTFDAAAIAVLRGVGLFGGTAWERWHFEETERRAQAAEADRLRTIAERARELEQVKSNFLNLASHELRGPLAVLRGYASMLEDGTLGELPPNAAHIVPLMSRQAEQMGRLIDQLLDTARLEEGRLGVHVSPSDLSTVVTGAIDEIRARVAEGRQLVVTLADPGPTVLADRGRLATVIVNLVDNALKYSPVESPVRISVSVDDGLARVTVRDRGPGIAPSDLPRLFTRFGRIVTPENSHILGTGLGLHLSREVALMHGGDITVASVVGEGTTFTLTLPLLESSESGTPGGDGRGRTLELAALTAADAVRCSNDVRAATEGCATLEEGAQRMVDYLRRVLTDDGAPALALVRCFVTHPYMDLPADLRAVARASLGSDNVLPEMTCLTLVGSAGDDPAWCDRTRSRRHQAIPLQSDEAVAASPMVSQLISELGFERRIIVGGDADLLVDAAPQPYNVFHVENALGNPYIPDQAGFVVPNGIRSVVGVGGLLPTGRLVAVIMFSRAHVTREAATRFRTVAHGVRLGLARFPSDRVFRTAVRGTTRKDGGDPEDA